MHVKYKYKTWNTYSEKWYIPLKIKRKIINIPVAKAAEDAPTISNAMILPFSLPEKAFTCGEAVIYREYASELDLGIKKSDDCRCTYPFIFQIRSTVVPLTENDARSIDSMKN